MIQVHSAFGDGGVDVDINKQTITVKVQFGTYSLNQEQTDVRGEYSQNETFEVEPHWIVDELKDFIMENASFRWQGSTAREYLAGCSEPRVLFTINDQRGANRDFSLTMGQYYDTRPKKEKYPRYNYVPVLFGLVDQLDVDKAKENRARRTQGNLRRYLWFVNELNSGGLQLDHESLLELLTFPWSDCPYNYVDIPEGSVENRAHHIDTNRQKWETTVTETFDDLLLEWLQDPVHEDMLNCILTERTSEINLFSSPGHGGHGLGILLHHCKPYETTDTEKDTYSFFANNAWSKLFHFVKPPVHLRFLKKVSQVYREASALSSGRGGHPFSDPDYQSPLGGPSHDVGAFVKWTAWANQNVERQVRMEVNCLLMIRNRQSCLSVIPVDLVLVIASYIWASREAVPDSFLLTPPGRHWLD